VISAKNMSLLFGGSASLKHPAKPAHAVRCNAAAISIAMHSGCVKLSGNMTTDDLVANTASRRKVTKLKLRLIDISNLAAAQFSSASSVEPKGKVNYSVEPLL